MPDRAEIAASIYRAIDLLNEQLPEGDRLAQSPDAPLHGGAGPLDSLGLINLIWNVEQAIEEDFGVTIALTSEQAFATFGRGEDPFRRLDLLIDYVARIVQGERAEGRNAA